VFAFIYFIITLSAQHTNKPKLQCTSPENKFKHLHIIITWN